jgi:hypothetical protein
MSFFMRGSFFAVYMARTIEKMKIVVRITLLLIFLLLYLNLRRLTEMLIVMLSAPFALAGGVWLMWLVNYNMSVAVGFIALAGVAAETGVVMLIYLEHAWEDVKAERRASGTVPNAADLYAAVMEGAVERVRPKMMTVVALMAGLLPILWGTGTGSEVMSQIATPMVGGRFRRRYSRWRSFRRCMRWSSNGGSRRDWKSKSEAGDGRAETINRRHFRITAIWRLYRKMAMILCSLERCSRNIFPAGPALAAKKPVALHGRWRLLDSQYCRSSEYAEQHKAFDL